MKENTTQINHENIIKLNFVENEVLQSSQEMELRKMDLERAALLGNIFHNKVKIYFESKEGSKEIESTIWACSEKFIALYDSVIIPINCIKKIEVA